MIWRRDPLVSPDFEKRARKSVREALRAKPAERRRARTLRRSARSSGMITLISYTALACFGIWSGLQSPGINENGRLGMLTVVAFCVALLRRPLLLKELHASPSLFALSLWPVSKDSAFERQSSLGLHRRWICDMLTLAICIALVQEWELGLVQGLGVIVSGLALRLTSQSVATILALSSRGLYLGHIGLGFFCMQLFSRRYPAVAASLDAFWNSSGETLSMVLPTGWALRVLRGILDGRPLSQAAWILPIAGLSWAMPWALRKLRSSYEFRDAVLLQYAAETPKSWSEEDRAAYQSILVNVPTQPVPELATRLESREFLTSQIEAPSLLDRLWLRWLTPRERTVLEWAQMGSLCLWRNLVWSMGLGVLGVILSYAVSRGEPGHDIGWFIAAGTAIAMQWTLRAGVMTRAFQPIQNMTLQTPRIAFVPVTLAEITAMLLKLAILLVPILAPLMMMIGGALSWTMGLEPWELGRVGLGLGLAFPGLMLFYLLLPTAGPGPLTWRSTLVGLALMGPPVLAFFGCLFVVAVWNSPWAAAAAVLGNLLMVLAFVAFRWMHQRRLFDMIGPIQS